MNHSMDFQAGTVWYRFLHTFFANAVVFAAANWGCCWNHHQMLKVRCMIIYHFINEGCRCHIAIKSGADDRRWINRDRTSQFRGPNSTRTFLSPSVFPCVLDKKTNSIVNIYIDVEWNYPLHRKCECTSTLPVPNSTITVDNFLMIIFVCGGGVVCLLALFFFFFFAASFSEKSIPRDIL